MGRKKRNCITEGISERFRQIRKERGYSQIEFGELLDITGSQISSIEIGNSGITLEAYSILVKELGIDPYWLLFNENSDDRKNRLNQVQSAVEKLQGELDKLKKEI